MRDKYEIKDAMETLIRAEDIKSDPKLMKDVLRYAKDQKMAIESIEDLKKAYENALENEEEDEEEMPKEEARISDRYAKAKEEANAPEIPMVKVVD